MSIYLIVMASSLVFGIYYFGLLYWWYGKLVRLAARHDIRGRRMRVSFWFPVVALLFVGPLFATAFCLLKLGPETKFLVMPCLLLSCAPGVSWWWRKRLGLVDLGYGSQGRRRVR